MRQLSQKWAVLQCGKNAPFIGRVEKDSETSVCSTESSVLRILGGSRSNQPQQWQIRWFSTSVFREVYYKGSLYPRNFAFSGGFGHLY